MIPLLRREFTPRDTWEVIVFTPGNRPFHRLAAALVALWVPDHDEATRIEQGTKLGDLFEQAQEVALEAAILRAKERSERADRLLLVVDQFEELFTMAQEAARAPFVGALLAAAAVSPVTVVLTLRADFYGQAIGLSRTLSDAIEHGLVNIGPMRSDELRCAIEEPARRVGLTFEPGLVDRILRDVEHQPGNLPLLEHALTELWVGRAEGHLRHDTYNAFGGVGGAIGSTAEQVFNRLSPDEQALALSTLTRLVRVSSANEEGTDTRLRIKLRNLGGPARPVMMDFVKKRLLVTDREEATNDEVVEVAHEALFRSWHRLKARLDADRVFLIWRQRLDFYLAEWVRAEHDEDALLRGALLKEAAHWEATHGEHLNDQEREYLQRSKEIQVSPRTAGFRFEDLLADSADLIAPASYSKDLEVIINFMTVQFILGNHDIAVMALGRVEDRSRSSAALASVAAALARVNLDGAASRAAEAAISAAGQVEDQSRRSEALAFVAANLAEAGQAEAAISAAGQVEDRSRRSAALASVAVALARVNLDGAASRAAEAAISAAGQVEDQSRRSEAMAFVAEALARAGLHGAASRAAGRVEDWSWRSAALAFVAEALARAGLHGAALQAAGQVEDRSRRSESLALAVETLAGADRVEVSIDVARRVEDTSRRSEVLAFEATTLAADGQVEAALEAAARVEDRSWHSAALASVAANLAEAGQAEAAISAAGQVEDRSRRSAALASVAAALARVNLDGAASRAAEAAISAADQVEDQSRRSEALAFVAEALARAELHGAALQAAGQVEDRSWRSEALASVAEAMAGAGQAEAAISTAGQVEDRSRRSAALAFVAEALARAGLHEAALQSAGQVEDRSRRSAALASVAEALTAAGLGEAALDAARRIEDRSLSSAALASAVRVLIEIGRVDEGFNAAKEIADDGLRSLTLATVATSMAWKGLFSQARETAKLCDSPSDRLSAYTTVIQEFSSRNDPALRAVFDILFK